jgi:predicted ester cyclase
MSEMSDQNKALTVEYFMKAMNNADLPLVADLLSPNYTYNGQPSSVADNQAWIKSLHQDFPGLQFSIIQILAEDQYVALQWRMDVPASGGKPAGYYSGINILTFVGGQALSNNQGGGETFYPNT